MKVLKFGAVWCSGCLVMRPRWNEIEKENPWLETEYFDFDSERKMVEQFNVNSSVLPVCIFIDRFGKEILRFSGEVEKKVLLQEIAKYKEE